MPFEIVREDITNMQVDAVVNAANTALQQGGGVCGAIFRAAGERELQRACNAIGHIGTGQAVITPGFGLKAKYIIHTAGPVWRGGGQGEEEQLKSCYQSSLRLARDNGCESVAFPLISSGIYGYPKEQALRVASEAILAYLETDDADGEMTAYLCVFDKAAFSLSQQLLETVRSYIDDIYVDERMPLARRLLCAEEEALRGTPVMHKHSGLPPVGGPPTPSPAQMQAAHEGGKLAAAGLEELIGNLDESFSQTLLRLIDAKGKTDVEVYKRANLDRRLFSKIRSNASYMPSKRTAVALCVALELDLRQARDLLARAGFTLSRSQKFDVIVEYFLSMQNYDIFTINDTLFYFDQPLLGG